MSNELLDQNLQAILDQAFQQILDDGTIGAINATFAAVDSSASSPDIFQATVFDSTVGINAVFAAVEDTQDSTQIFIGVAQPVSTPDVGSPLTDDQFKAWLADPSAARCVLVEAIANINGVDFIYYLSNLGYVTSTVDTPATTHYDSVIMGGCEITEEISLQGGEGRMTVGDIEISNVNGVFDAWLGYIWTARPIRVYYGDMRWPRASFRLVFNGVIEDIASRSRNVLNIIIRDKLQRLNTTLSSHKLGGDTQNADRLIPITLGEVSNVEPLLVDPATLTYQAHDGWMQQFIEVRDNGVPVSIEVLADGKFSLQANPDGVITCSLQGAKPDGNYLNTVASLVQYLGMSYGTDPFTTSDFDVTSLAAFDIANPHRVGVYCLGRENILEICNSLAESIGARVVITPLNLLKLIKIQLPPNGNSTIVNESNFKVKSFELIERVKPAPSVKIGYDKNWTVQKNLQTGIPEEHKDLFEEEWLTYTAVDPVYRDLYKLPSEPPKQIDTYLINIATAQSEGNRRRDMWKVQRSIYKYDGFPELLLEELGGSQFIIHNRFNMQGGAQAQILGVTRNWFFGTVSFKVLI